MGGIYWGKWFVICLCIDTIIVTIYCTAKSHLNQLSDGFEMRYSIIYYWSTKDGYSARSVTPQIFDRFLLTSESASGLVVEAPESSASPLVALGPVLPPKPLTHCQGQPIANILILPNGRDTLRLMRFLRTWIRRTCFG
mgnify:FL=1|jgi:hypothetical protein